MTSVLVQPSVYESWCDACGRRGRIEPWQLTPRDWLSLDARFHGAASIRVDGDACSPTCALVLVSRALFPGPEPTAGDAAPPAAPTDPGASRP